MVPQLSKEGVTIVLRGNFNPSIFHPSWFLSYRLLRTQEAENAKIEIVHPEAAVFTSEWLKISVTRDRFNAGSSQESHYEAVRDLVVGVFSLLNHTPLTAVGINRDFHYRLESEDLVNSIGNRLAPKQDWEDLLSEPGMLSLAMRGNRTDNLDGYIHVKVEPSALEKPGVFVAVNDHYQLKSGEGLLSKTGDATRIIADQWKVSMDRALRISQKIAGLGETK